MYPRRHAEQPKPYSRPRAKPAPTPPLGPDLNPTPSPEPSPEPSPAPTPAPEASPPAASESPTADQSYDANGPRRVHTETGEMQWRDSPAADVPGAVYWPYDLAKMFGMSMFFYEQQRLGPLPPDTRPPWRADSLKREGGGWLDGDAYKGGYADAGDHLKFMLPAAYSVARLAWTAHAYAGTLESTSFDGSDNLAWARQTVKWGCDFFARAVEDDRTLLHLGDIEADHSYIGRAEDYPQIERTEVWCDFGKCSDVTGEIAATLAHAAAAFVHEPELSAVYWEKAKAAYAQTNIGPDSFGNSNDVYAPLAVYYASSGVVSHVFFGAASMYSACMALDACSDDEASQYRADAERLGNMKEPDGGQRWFYPSETWDSAWFSGAALMASHGIAGPDIFGNEAFKFFLADFAKKWVGGQDPITISPNGQRWISAWASLRYSMNGASILLMWANLDESMREGAEVTAQDARCAAMRQILYVGGMNDRGSYMAGFGDNAPKRNHHRNSVCSPAEQRESDAFTCLTYFADVVDPRGSCPSFDDESLGICYKSANRPNKYQTAGALIGGPKTPDDAGDQSRLPYSDEGFNDWRNDYIGSEQGLDYNAGLSLALAAAMGLDDQFWTTGCAGTDDFSSMVGAAKANEASVAETWSDSETTTFADFEQFGWTRTLDADWMKKLPDQY